MVAAAIQDLLPWLGGVEAIEVLMPSGSDASLPEWVPVEWQTVSTVVLDDRPAGVWVAAGDGTATQMLGTSWRRVQLEPGAESSAVHSSVVTALIAVVRTPPFLFGVSTTGCGALRNKSNRLPYIGHQTTLPGRTAEAHHAAARRCLRNIQALLW